MKTTLIVFFAGALIASAETEERLNKQFAVQADGKILVDVEFGSVDVVTNASDKVTIDVLRKVTRSSKEEEETFLSERPITFSQDGNSIIVSSHAKTRFGKAWHGRTEGRYTITVPARFGAQLKTAGGGISASDLSGGVTANTSGGSFKFTRLQGTLNAETSGGSISVTGCEGTLNVRTSGGGIDVVGGTGSLDGKTSGGKVAVKDFRGTTHVRSSGGGIQVENVTGDVQGSTSGGSISASFSSPPSDGVKLETSGGGVTLMVPENSAFDLDASTTGGKVHSDIPVAVTGKANPTHLKGPVNGGGKAVILRTSGGSIHVRKI